MRIIGLSSKVFKVMIYQNSPFQFQIFIGVTIPLATLFFNILLNRIDILIFIIWYLLKSILHIIQMPLMMMLILMRPLLFMSIIILMKKEQVNFHIHIIN